MHDKIFDLTRNHARSHDRIFIVISNPARDYDISQSWSKVVREISDSDVQSPLTWLFSPYLRTSNHALAFNLPLEFIFSLPVNTLFIKVLMVCKDVFRKILEISSRLWWAQDIRNDFSLFIRSEWTNSFLPLLVREFSFITWHKNLLDENNFKNWSSHGCFFY